MSHCICSFHIRTTKKESKAWVFMPWLCKTQVFFRPSDWLSPVFTSSDWLLTVITRHGRVVICSMVIASTMASKVSAQHHTSLCIQSFVRREIVVANFFSRRKEIRKHLEVKDEGISDDLLRSFYVVFRFRCGINRLQGGQFSESKMMDLRAPRKMIMTKSK